MPRRRTPGHSSNCSVCKYTGGIVRGVYPVGGIGSDASAEEQICVSKGHQQHARSPYFSHALLS